MADLKHITAELENIAREAGNFIRNEVSHFDMSRAEVKGLNNFVSYVDKSAEEIIVKRLKNLLPEAGFKTEEGTTKQAEGQRYVWVIDPLDGTTNFMHGCPPFAVSIGLKENDEEVAGVVYEITADEMFTGWKNGGAWLNGKQIHVSSAASLSESLVATGFPYSDFSRLDKYIELFTWFLKHSHGVRRLGSAATDIVYIACGRFEAFYEYGLYPWDIAAATIILREAGGKISDFSGNEKGLTGKEVVAASEPVFLEILKIVSNFMKN
ncbi:MAG TPA: inositol monophosphatase family protein [Bacteroidales bacterium]|nr:inositol monophosphatase family protein [Bacteroidales bacterium]